jgi:dephospho-CoA kinase
VIRNTSPPTNHPFVVALTGGIASGKTLISDEFARLGVSVIDTDVIAHEIVEPGKPALLEIEQAFGAQILDVNGGLKRSELRALIFSDSDARRKLEAILHPIIRQEVSKSISEVTSAYCILVIPLLAGRGDYPDVDRVLVVDVAPEVQIDRLMVRDNCSREQAELALKSQASREDRLKIADDVLDNSGSPEQAVLEVARFHEKYGGMVRNFTRG